MQTWLSCYYTITAWVLHIQRWWLSPVYTIQPVVKPVVNRFDNQLNVCIHDTDNRLYRVYKHSTGCQTRLTTGLTTGCISCIHPVVKPVVHPGLTTGWTNSCSFNTVWQPFWQPVGCLFTRYSRLSNRLSTVWQPAVSCKRGITRHREHNVRACECLEHAKVHTPIHTPIKLRGEGKLCREFKFEKQKP